MRVASRRRHSLALRICSIGAADATPLAYPLVFSIRTRSSRKNAIAMKMALAR